MPRGKPDRKRHRLVAKLRAQGLGYQAIADRLRISPQRVHQILLRSGSPRTFPILCRKCKAIIVQMGMNTNNNGPVYCLKCPPKDTTFGERLKAHRLAAGLTLRAISRQVGLQAMAISRYERGKSQALWPSIATLIRVLGVNYLDVR